MEENTRQVIRFPALSKKLGNISRSTIFRWERDKEFPRHIKLGANTCGWFLHQIDAWLLSREESLTGKLQGATNETR